MSIMHAATIQSRMHNMTCWIWQKSHCQRPAADTPLVLAVSPLVAQWPWGSESHDDRVETALTLPQYTARGITTLGFQLNHKDSRMLNRRLKIKIGYCETSQRFLWQLYCRPRHHQPATRDRLRFTACRFKLGLWSKVQQQTWWMYRCV